MRWRSFFVGFFMLSLLWVHKAAAVEFTGIIEWKDKTGSSQDFTIDIFQMDDTLPILRIGPTKLLKPLRLKVSDLAPGVYLMVIRAATSSTPLIRWINLTKPEPSPQEMRVTLTRRVFEQIGESYEEYRAFLVSVHRNPLHQSEGSQFPKRSRAPGDHLTQTGWAVSYWGSLVPWDLERPSLLQNTTWQWSKRVDFTLHWQFRGDISTGAYNRWNAQSKIQWEVLRAHQVIFQFAYEQGDAYKGSGGDYQVSQVSLQDHWELPSQWKVHLKTSARLWMNELGNPYLAYDVVGEGKKESGEGNGWVIQAGLGRHSWLDIIPAHPYRQALWFEQWVGSSFRWNEWFAQRRWLSLGFHDRLRPGSWTVRLQYQNLEGPWTEHKGLHDALMELSYEIPTSLGELGFRYVLERVWYPLDNFLQPGSRNSWTPFVESYLKVRTPRAGTLTICYAMTRPGLFFSRTSEGILRSLDIEWRQPITIIGSSGMQLEFRLAVLNTLGKGNPFTGEIVPEDRYFWLQLPRAWVWSLQSRW